MRMRWRLGLCLTALLLVAVATSQAGAQSPARLISATLTPATATVGDRLTLTIVVEHDAAATAEGPGFAGDFGGLEAVDVAAPRTEDAGGTRRTTLVYTLTAFRTGDVLVPPITVVLRGPNGVDRLATDPLRVSITSVLAPGDITLRPLKPQLDLGDDAPSPAVPAAVVAGFALMTALGYVLFRRAQAIWPQPLLVAEAPPVARSPQDVARAALGEIDASGLASSDPGEYYARISEVVRRYLSERFGFEAYAMTRRELERHMSSAEMDRWVGRVTANLLEQCEAAEFAGVVQAMERRDADLTAAYEIVAITAEDVSEGSEM